MSHLACYGGMCTDHALHAEMEQTLVRTQHKNEKAYIGHMIWNDCGIETRSNILIKDHSLPIIREKILVANSKENKNYHLFGHWILHNLERHFLVKDVHAFQDEAVVRDVIHCEME